MDDYETMNLKWLCSDTVTVRRKVTNIESCADKWGFAAISLTTWISDPWFRGRPWKSWNPVTEKPLITISVIVLMGLKDENVERNASATGSVSKGNRDSTGHWAGGQPSYILAKHSGCAIVIAHHSYPGLQ